MLYPSHTSTLTRIESEINIIIIPGLPRDRSHGKRGKFGLNKITRDIFPNSRPYSGGGAKVLSRDKACN